MWPNPARRLIAAECCIELHSPADLNCNGVLVLSAFCKLKSLPDAQRYLKPETSFDMLDRITANQSDFDA